MHIDMQKGLPSIWMLIFTILLWMLFSAILLSNKKGPMNRWSFIAGIFFSGGVFKEYLYFGVVPTLLVRYPSLSIDFYTGIYSVMTALLYYLAMPSVMMLVFHFAELPQRHPRLFKTVRLLIFIPAVLFELVIPYTQTRYYQLHLSAYYLTVSVYNWLYGILITTLLLTTLYRKRLSHDYQQRCLITVNVLLPMWYWLLSAFLIHSLRLYGFFKLWQGNILIIFFLLCYFACNLFKDGIWGSRLYRETYDIQSPRTAHGNSQYVTHALKNEVTKIKWCTSSLLEQATKEQEPKLQIILRSTQHLEHFMERTQLLSQDIRLHPDTFPVYPVLERCIQDTSAAAGTGAHIDLQCKKDEVLYTDQEHFIEMMHNLLSNALEAVQGNGTIQMNYSIHPVKRCAVLTVTDDGHGIANKACRHLFQPYYTTKGSTMGHLGLGLYYCSQVMEQQGGGIRVKSIPGQGSTFFLYFPYKKAKYHQMPVEKKEKNDEQEQ